MSLRIARNWYGVGALLLLIVGVAAFLVFLAALASMQGATYEVPRQVPRAVSQSADGLPAVTAAGGGGGGAGPDILVDFETGADGDVVRSNATPADLRAAISIGAATTITPTIGSNNTAIASNNLIRISTTQAKSGTRSLRVDCTNASGAGAGPVGDWVEFTTAFAMPKCSMSYWMRLDTAFNGSDFGSHDMSRYYSSGGVYLINNVDTQPDNIQYGCHTPSDVATQFRFQTNVWYNVQKFWDSATGGCLLRYYSNGVSLGQSSNNISAASVLRFQFGHVDGHGKFIALSSAVHGFAYFDDLEIYTNGAKGTPWPITPNTGFP